MRALPLHAAAAQPSPAPTLGAARAGEEQCAGDLAVVRGQVDGVFRFLRCLGASREEAEDLTQESFAVAWRKGKQRLPAPALAAFLRRTARFLWLDHRRGERRAEAAISAYALLAWERDEVGDGSEVAAAARECVQQLRGRAARAVELAYGGGAGRDDVAQSLGMLPNGVKTLLARTRTWLEQCIRRRLA